MNEAYVRLRVVGFTWCAARLGRCRESKPDSFVAPPAVKSHDMTPSPGPGCRRQSEASKRPLARPRSGLLNLQPQTPF